MKGCLGLLLLLLLPCTYASSKVVNLYIWSSYIPNSIIKSFEKKTGITVNVTTFDSNETMYAKLTADPRSGYDIIVPSSYYVDRMRKEGMLHKLNKKWLPNLKHLNPSLMHLPFDPHNDYSIPYLWGTTGIVINKKYWNPKTITRWADLWQRRFKDQLLILNDPREAFAIALLRLGYSINTRKPNQIKQAYELLRKLMPNIKVFNSDAEINMYIDEDITAGIGWSGDVHLAQEENANVDFIYPKGKFSLWIDCMAIPKYAAHFQNAERFLNFLMKPKIAKQIMIAEGYSSPNLGAMKLLPKKLRDNPVVDPSPVLLKRAVVQLDVGSANALYNHYWELLKLGA